jgi:hypothetical protein
MSLFRQSVSVLLLFTLSVIPALPQSAPAADHVVSMGDLHQSILAVAQARQTNLAKIRGFLETESARKVIEAMKFDSAQITLAISVLSDEELSRLAVQSEKIQKDVTAGELRKGQLVKYIVLAAATTILIWVIVTHRAT